MLRSHEPHLGRKVSAWKRINTEVTDGSKEVLLRKFQGRTPRRAERRSAAQRICASQRGSAGRGRLQGRGRREEAPRDGRSPGRSSARTRPRRQAVATVPGSHGASLSHKPSANLGYFCSKMVEGGRTSLRVKRTGNS